MIACEASMSDTSELHIVLKPAIADVVRQAVSRGEYASDSEAIGAAVLEWRLRRALDPADADTICRLWDEGRASGPGRFGSMDEIKQAARRRLAAKHC
jgi:antitoxin ParD1/3/4